MKLSLAILAAVVSSTVGVTVDSISANSKMGQNLLSKARLLEEDENEEYYENDMTWVEDFAIKFIGCNQVAQWNDQADEDNDVRITTQKHVHFRLCPNRRCSNDSAYGCKAGYGDYIVDMETFVQEYLDNVQNIKESACATAKNNCDCEGNDDEDGCYNQCYYDAGYEQCIEEEDAVIALEDYSQCAEFAYQGGNDDGNGRKLGEDEDDDGNQYYIGPYCSAQGGGVVLGMFTDNTCTTAADSNYGLETFEAMTGAALPYSSSPVVDKKCYTCAYVNEDDGGDEVRETCTNIYQSSGKCESRLFETISDPNEAACNYIHGLKITPVKENGIVYREYHGTRKAAIAIAFFVTHFVLLAFYVCYLKERVKQHKHSRGARQQEYMPKKKIGLFRKISNSFKNRKSRRGGSKGSGGSVTSSSSRKGKNQSLL